jgi:hypothetical protein
MFIIDTTYQTITRPLPLIKPIRRNQASSSAKRLAEARLILDCFGPRIDEPFPVFAQGPNETPLKERGFAFTVILNNC